MSDATVADYNTIDTDDLQILIPDMNTGEQGMMIIQRMIIP